MSCLLFSLSQPAAPSDSTASVAAANRRTVRPVPVRFPVIARSLLSESRRPAFQAGSRLDRPRRHLVPFISGRPDDSTRDDELDPLLHREAGVEDIAFLREYQE